jgi:hypothetical protein
VTLESDSHVSRQWAKLKQVVRDGASAWPRTPKAKRKALLALIASHGDPRTAVEIAAGLLEDASSSSPGSRHHQDCSSGGGEGSVHCVPGSPLVDRNNKGDGRSSFDPLRGASSKNTITRNPDRSRLLQAAWLAVFPNEPMEGALSASLSTAPVRSRKGGSDGEL